MVWGRFSVGLAWTCPKIPSAIYIHTYCYVHRLPGADRCGGMFRWPWLTPFAVRNCLKQHDDLIVFFGGVCVCVGWGGGGGGGGAGVLPRYSIPDRDSLSACKLAVPNHGQSCELFHSECYPQESTRLGPFKSRLLVLDSWRRYSRLTAHCFLYPVSTLA